VKASVAAICVAETTRSVKRAGIGVPLFVAQGDRIEIDTRTGEYRKRV